MIVSCNCLGREPESNAQQSVDSALAYILLADWFREGSTDASIEAKTKPTPPTRMPMHTLMTASELCTLLDVTASSRRALSHMQQAISLFLHAERSALRARFISAMERASERASRWNNGRVQATS